MTPWSTIVSVSALCVMTTAVVVRGQGGGGNPEAQARQRQQQELEASTPKLQVTEEILALSVAGHTIGETEGVSRNSKGHLFVYSRTGTSGSSRGGTAAELFEFDQNLKFVKMWGPGNYAASFAHAVRVDKYDNVWMVDEGSNMIVKFDPNAMVKMVLGRKPEAIDYFEKYLERGEKDTERVPLAGVGTFNRETVGELPTELVPHFFRSLADGLRATLHVRVRGENTHHMIEACFKGVGRALRGAIHREGAELPSTKGVL